MNDDLYLNLIIVSVITHIIRSVYEILKYKKILKVNSVIFIIILINMFLLWMSWMGLCSLDNYKVMIPDIIRYSGIILCGIGVIIFLTALFTIKSLETYEGNLLTRGIYSKIRHPMYLAFIFWLIGFPVFYGTLYLLILSCIFIANVLFWRYLEEKELGKRYPSYADYRKTTIF